MAAFVALALPSRSFGFDYKCSSVTNGVATCSGPVSSTVDPCPPPGSNQIDFVDVFIPDDTVDGSVSDDAPSTIDCGNGLKGIKQASADHAAPLTAAQNGGLAESVPPGKRIYRVSYYVNNPSGSGNSGGATPTVNFTVDLKLPQRSYDLAVEFVNPPARVQLGTSYFFLTVRVTNSGPAASRPALLELHRDSHTFADGDYRSDLVARGLIGQHARAGDIPSLPSGGSKDFTINVHESREHAFPLVFSLGSVTLAVTIAPDGDPPDDNPSPTGEDAASHTTQIVAAGASAANCPGASGARASAAGCTVAHGRARSFSGSASGDVRQVQIAIESAGKGARAARARGQCEALAGSSGRLQPGPAINGVCSRLRWLTARGTTHWRYDLRRSLPRGRYVLYTRPVTSIGTPGSGFTAPERLAFTVR